MARKHCDALSGSSKIILDTIISTEKSKVNAQEFKQKFDQEDDENYAKYYKLLGIPTDATYDEVRKRFHKLVLKYHPDRYIGSKKKAAEKFKKIFEAHQKIMERMRVRA